MLCRADVLHAARHEQSSIEALSALADGEDYLLAHLSCIFPHRICSTICAKLLVHPKALAQQRTPNASDGRGDLKALTCCSPVC